MTFKIRFNSIVVHLLGNDLRSRIEIRKEQLLLELREW